MNYLSSERVWGHKSPLLKNYLPFSNGLSLRIILFKGMFSSEANRVPIPQKSPSPSPKFGDRVGTGKVFLDSSGKIRGLEELNSWGFSGINSPKIPKV